MNSPATTASTTTIPGLASLNQLKDIGLRVQLPPKLQVRIQETLTRLPSSDQTDKSYYFHAMETVEACIAFLDAEITRMTQERFAAGDPGAVRQKLLGEPKKLADGAVVQLKQRMGNEKGEWSRRITKQIMNIQAQAEAEINRMEVSVTHAGSDLVVQPTEEWLVGYGRWAREVFSTWSQHMVELLRTKTTQLVEPDLDALSEMIQERLYVALSVANAPPLPEGSNMRDVIEKVETPTLVATVFESFQGGLNTVGMLAGMVIIPVVGQLMHTATTEVRAIAMGGAVTPVLILAVWRGRGTRKRMVEANAAKATEKLRKAYASDFKAQIERFKLETERACQSYLGQAQSAVLAIVEPAIARQFEKREQVVAQEQARVQLQNDKLMEQINACKAARSGLSGQLVVDLKRKLGA